MTSIAPVSHNNIETQRRCGLKSVFSGEVHSQKRIHRNYDGRWMLILRCVRPFIFSRKILTDFALRISSVSV